MLGSSLCKDLMLGEFASLFSEVSVKDPAASTRSGVRDRGEVVNGVLQTVLRAPRFPRLAFTASMALSRVDSAATAAEALEQTGQPLTCRHLH